MKVLSSLVLVAVLASPALSGDLVVTKEKHKDPMMGQPAQDTVEVLWIGKDRLRVDEGDSITLVRADLEKMYMIDSKKKTYSVVDLPLDIKKYVPAEMAPMMEQMTSMMKVTVTPTTETKQIKDWNATHYTVKMSMGMGGGTTQEMWVTKDVAADRAGWQEMYAALMGSNPFGGAMAAEMKKIEGLAVLVETTTEMMGNVVKSREAVVSVEEKEPAEGFYELPSGLTEKPFDPMAEMHGPGGPGGRPRGR